MSDQDEKVLRRYRELARDEPPASVDAAILAASRRAVGSRRWSQRFAGPVSIAAVLVLALGVTLNMQRGEPGIETSAPSEYDLPKPAAPEPGRAPAAAPEAPPAAAPAQSPPADTFQPDALARKGAPAPARNAERAMKKEIAADSVPASPAPARAEPRPFAAPPVQEMPAAAAIELRDAQKARIDTQSKPAAESKDALVAAAPAAAQARAAPPAKLAAIADPAAELERIARLRTEGRNEEADKAIDEFLRARPDYRIPDPLWERVRRR